MTDGSVPFRSRYLGERASEGLCIVLASSVGNLEWCVADVGIVWKNGMRKLLSWKPLCVMSMALFANHVLFNQ